MMNGKMETQQTKHTFLLHCNECGVWFESEFDMEICDECLSEHRRIVNRNKINYGI